MTTSPNVSLARGTRRNAPKRFRPLVRHPNAHACPTCRWLNIHTDYELKYLCENKDCATCAELHASRPFGWLRGLKRSDGKFAIALNLGLINEENGKHHHGCVASYTYKYLAHVLRNGDCIMVYAETETERYNNTGLGKPGILMFHNKLFWRSNGSNIPCSVDITDFGRANYFKEVVDADTFVWTSFTGYDGQLIQDEEESDSALWKATKNVDAARAILTLIMIPEMVGLIVSWLHDEWYIFSSLKEGEIKTDKSTYYQWNCSGNRYDRGTFCSRLLSPQNKTIGNKDKVLYTYEFNSRA